MAKLGKTRNDFHRYGCVGENGTTADAGTIHWPTVTMGLDGAATLNGMDKTVTESVMKRLARDADDTNIVEAQRPSSTVRVMQAITMVVQGIRYYSGRGVTLDDTLMQRLNHNNARDFFRKFVIYQQKDVDMSDDIMLPVLPGNVAINSPIYLEFKDELKIALGAITSKDGIGTLAANICEHEVATDWDDVDMNWNLHKIAGRLQS